ncbi:ATP-binding protein, partial [Chryseobacterium gambrini]
MRFVDLSLTDFGVYRNARLDEIGEGINVVAGPQRAGKTTFMQAVRQ